MGSLGLGPRAARARGVNASFVFHLRVRENLDLFGHLIRFARTICARDLNPSVLGLATFALSSISVSDTSPASQRISSNLWGVAN